MGNDVVSVLLRAGTGADAVGINRLALRFRSMHEYRSICGYKERR